MPQFLKILTESWPYFLGGAVIAFPLIQLNIRFATRLGLIDWPKARGVAEEQIPIIGTSIVLLSIGFLLYLTKFHNLSPWIVLTSMIMAVMGLLDDRRPISAGDKMFFQMICAAAAVGFDPNIHAQMTVRYGYMGTVLAFLFIIALINAINFIDGIDGLAGLVLFMGSAAVILFVNGSSRHWPYAMFAAALCGMLLP